jgi:hypothetical protein
MPNHVLESFQSQREAEISRMDSILGQVDGRDLSDAERGILEASRSRISELDAQIEPLEQYEVLVSRHGATLADLPRGGPERLPAQPRRADGLERAPEYRSAGEFLVDHLRARGMDGAPDQAATARMGQLRAVANNITTDVPGVLPTPIVGQVVNLIDANRPLISSLGGSHPMAGIPGTSFTRPRISQHTTSGPQTAEKTELPSRALKIDPIPFNKTTRGGTVDISRQVIDWTSPAAWDIIVRDLSDSYAIDTETTVSAAFRTAATGAAVAVEDNTLEGWATALYAAAAASYGVARKLPDRIWVSLDVWAQLGPLADINKLVFPPGGNAGAAGESNLTNFQGNMFAVPRIVVPTFAAGTCIIGSSDLYEVYEETIGLLSVVEPSILGVTVAYGGYVAFGSLSGASFIPVTPPAAP